MRTFQNSSQAHALCMGNCAFGGIPDSVYTNGVVFIVRILL